MTSAIASWLPAEPRADGARATDRAKWDPLAATKEGRARIAKAEKLLGEPVPETPDELYLEFSRNGNRRNYEKCLSARHGGLQNLLVAECLEHKGRFVAKTVEYVDAICAMRSWTLPAHDGSLTCFNGDPHVDLVSADISLTLAFCHDWLRDELPSETLGNIAAEVEGRYGPRRLGFRARRLKVRGNRESRQETSAQACLCVREARYVGRNHDVILAMTPVGRGPICNEVLSFAREQPRTSSHGRKILGKNLQNRLRVAGRGIF